MVVREEEFIGNDDSSEQSEIELIADKEITNYFRNLPEDEEMNDRLRCLALSFGM